MTAAQTVIAPTKQAAMAMQNRSNVFLILSPGTTIQITVSNPAFRGVKNTVHLLVGPL
jgi:nitrogenase molybdenum-iron protein alpha/beta subunit